MADSKNLNPFDQCLENCEWKYNPNANKDVKRKLSFIQKKISDLHRQRRLAYKNSSKVKKTIHNQVNQIVKCLRARERSLWVDVDEAYLLQDENISVEFSRLQSIYARCQALFDLLENDKGSVNVLEKIYSILSEVKFGEKPDFKELEFLSEFETLQSLANTFGHINTIFLPKEGLELDKKNTSSDLGESVNKTPSVVSLETDDSPNKFSSKSSECEDFEIVDLLDNMCCEDLDKDLVMVEQENSGTYSQLPECANTTSDFENKQRALNNDFNPEEEWKQILELKSKIASFSGITSKLSNENKNFDKQNTASNLNCDKGVEKKPERSSCLLSHEAHNWLQSSSSRNEKLFDKSYKQNALLMQNGADNWLHSKSSERNSLKERNIEKINFIANIELSPAEIIKKSFTSYLRKENIENWLLCNQ